MKKSQTAFLTTIFPACEKYLVNFFESLLVQTDSDFDIIVVNDGVLKFSKKFQNYFSKLNIIEIISMEKPVDNRIAGIKHVINESYEKLIFGDSDDFFCNNRIEQVKEKLNNCDIVVNEIKSFNNGVVGSKLLENIITNKFNFNKNITKSNVQGLSNTSINVNLLKEISLGVDNNIIAFDWFLFSVMIIIHSKNVCFLSNVITFYRQYTDNTIGNIQTINSELVKSIIITKKLHYNGLINYCNLNNYSEFSFIFENELELILEIEDYVKDAINLNNYIEVVNSNIEVIYKGWWSQLISLAELRKIEN